MRQGRLFERGQLQSNVLFKSASVSGLTIGALPTNTTFMAHHSSDVHETEQLARLLSRAGYPCYLDVFDPNVDGDDPALENYLRGVIAECSKLVAMVSGNTKTSWWVPLEIGVALEKEKYIATYMLTREQLPSYLWQWPMLRSSQDAIKWAQDTGRFTAKHINDLWRSRPRARRFEYYNL